MAWVRYEWPVAEMIQWYTVDGLSLNQIGKKLGRDFRLVHKVLKKNGVEMRSRGCMSQGAKNPAWRGGRVIDKQGYILVYCPDHPHANNQGKVREHRLIAEKILGRYLLPTEVVHHIDDDPQNNSHDNLLLFQNNAAHLAATLKGKCPKWTEDGKRRIREAVKKARRVRRFASSRSQSEHDDGQSIQTIDHSTDESDTAAAVL